MTTTNRSQFELSISTSPSDFGYGNKPAPTNAELVARIGVDKRGTVRSVQQYWQKQLRNLGSSDYRVVIRECATGRYWTRDEFAELLNELAA